MRHPDQVAARGERASGIEVEAAYARFRK